MTAQKAAINLLPEDPLASSFGGRFLRWGLSVGRYIVMATELVVILAFLSRFKLDREVTDLNEAIAEKQTVVAAYEQVEIDYRTLAKKIGAMATFKTGSVEPVVVLDQLAKVTPWEVTFSSIELTDKELRLQGTTASERGLNTLLKLLVKEGFKDLRVDQVSSLGEGGGGVGFKLTMSPK